MRAKRVRLFEDTRTEEACGLGREVTEVTSSISHVLSSVDEVGNFDGLVFTFGAFVSVSGVVTGAIGSPQVVCTGGAAAGVVLNASAARDCLRVSAFELTWASSRDQG